ncbi:MAG: hypothetical protein A2901_07080 [Elusimicrobia bacterium RIFCSPLOWO2_01_FULL_54_10]|nr:MAG: hypothetical protein A2901_07080 [Elusimicrobia bacterium RIFCSPLOWO2_01_FULL_54_10]
MKKILHLAFLFPALALAAPDSDVIEPVKTLSGHPGGIYSLSFSSDSQVLVSAGENGTINLWDMGDFHSMRTWKDHSDSVNSIFYSRSDKYLISGSDDGTVLARSATEYSIVDKAVLEGKVSSLAQSPGGKLLAVVLDESKIKLISARNYEAVKTLDGSHAVFSPDGRILAVSGPDNRIKILDADDFGVVTALVGHKAAMLALAFARDGLTLASASIDGAIKLWNPRAYKEIKTIKNKDYAVTALAFSPDHKFLAYGGMIFKDNTRYRNNDTEFYVWDLARGKKAAVLTGHRGAVLSLAFSPDGKWLVSGSKDKTIKVWAVQSWAPKSSKKNQPMKK